MCTCYVQFLSVYCCYCTLITSIHAEYSELYACLDLSILCCSSIHILLIFSRTVPLSPKFLALVQDLSLSGPFLLHLLGARLKDDVQEGCFVFFSVSTLLMYMFYLFYLFFL